MYDLLKKKKGFKVYKKINSDIFSAHINEAGQNIRNNLVQTLLQGCCIRVGLSLLFYIHIICK